MVQAKRHTEPTVPPEPVRTITLTLVADTEAGELGQRVSEAGKLQEVLAKARRRERLTDDLRDWTLEVEIQLRNARLGYGGTA